MKRLAIVAAVLFIAACRTENRTEVTDTSAPAMTPAPADTGAKADTTQKSDTTKKTP
jgi:hypothetical protein